MLNLIRVPHSFLFNYDLFGDEEEILAFKQGARYVQGVTQGSIERERLEAVCNG